MKNRSWDYLILALFIGSFYAVFMQGFAAPSLSDTGNLIFRVLAAATIQLFFCRRNWPILLRLLPLLITGLLALWGCLLYFRADASWQNATFFDLLRDYLSPAIACGTTAILHRLFRNIER